MNNRGILRVLVIGKVSRCAVQVELTNVGGVDLGVPLLVELLGDEPFQFLSNNGSVWFPKNQALPHLLINVKEIQIFSYYPVVTLFRLLQAGQMLSKFILGGESCSVNSLQLLL